MPPVTVTDIAKFVQMVITAFSDPIFFAVVCLIGFSVLYHVKCLIVDGNL
jgi:hypothetical protein